MSNDIAGSKLCMVIEQEGKKRSTVFDCVVVRGTVNVEDEKAGSNIYLDHAVLV